MGLSRLLSCLLVYFPPVLATVLSASCRGICHPHYRRLPAPHHFHPPPDFNILRHHAIFWRHDYDANSAEGDIFYTKHIKLLNNEYYTLHVALNI